jgi:hypothetical protein
MFQSVSLKQPTCPHENFLRSCKVPKIFLLHLRPSHNKEIVGRTFLSHPPRHLPQDFVEISRLFNYGTRVFCSLCFFFLQFCDVAKLTIVHKKIQPNLAIDQI